MSSSQDSINSIGAYTPDNVDQGMLYYLNSIPTSCKEWPALNQFPFNTDDFRMHYFKVYPCRRTYTHVWSQCPFYHPGENAGRRRDPRIYTYSPLPCASFRHKGTCYKGDECEFSHGFFEKFLHPGQYRTTICRDGARCTRHMCFFAHDHLELRPIYTRTGCAEPEFPSQLPRMIRPQPVTLPTMPYSTVDDLNNRLSYLRMIQNQDFRLGHSNPGLGLHDTTPTTLWPDATSFFPHVRSPESYTSCDNIFYAGPFFDHDTLH